jgi:hypothetical protein
VCGGFGVGLYVDAYCPFSFPVLVKEVVMPRRKCPVRDVRVQSTVLIDVSTSERFKVLTSDEYALFLEGLVVQSEGQNQMKTTKEICNVI